MGGLAERPLAELLEDVAARRPAPGGGCGAGWTCALGAGLVEMTAAFTLADSEYAGRHERMTQIAARAGSLRLQATELAEREQDSYAPVLVALRLTDDDPARAGAVDDALSQAAETPLALARVAVEVAVLALEASRTGTRHLRGDALAGLLLAEGACQAAAQLVRINLAQRPHDERCRELAELTERAAAVRAEVL
jgi:methenyltetrahydrofolate cyclohydrolase